MMPAKKARLGLDGGLALSLKPTAIILAKATTTLKRILCISVSPFISSVRSEFTPACREQKT